VRVCIDARLVSGYAGGVETVVIGLASGFSALTDADDEFVFLAYHDHQHWLRPYISGPSRIELVPMPRTYRFGTSIPWGRALWRRIPVVPGLGVGGPPPSDGTAEILSADLVHQPLQRGFLTSIPTVYNPHDLQHLHLPEFFTRREIEVREARFRRLFEQAQLIGVTSSWGKADIADHYPSAASKVAVVPWAPILGVYPEPSSAQIATVKTRYGLPEGFLLYPAQTWPHKNHVNLLRAIAANRDRGLHVEVVFCGYQSAYHAELRESTHDLGLSGQVRWLGFVPAADLRGLYRLARAVVIPSRFEAASGPLWEAFQSGTAAACSNVTALPEQAGEAAIVFDPDDIDGIADAVSRLWTDSDLRALLVDRGRKRIGRFSWTRTVKTYRAHYRRLLGESLTIEDQSLLTADPGL
jgi:glycosyltransferase involved in cell wall biosynthesis